MVHFVPLCRDWRALCPLLDVKIQPLEVLRRQPRGPGRAQRFASLMGGTASPKTTCSVPNWTWSESAFDRPAAAANGTRQQWSTRHRSHCAQDNKDLDRTKPRNQYRVHQTPLSKARNGTARPRQSGVPDVIPDRIPGIEVKAGGWVTKRQPGLDGVVRISTGKVLGWILECREAWSAQTCRSREGICMPAPYVFKRSLRACVRSVRLVLLISLLDRLMRADSPHSGRPSWMS
jgi:hypothetical protein